MKNQLQFLFTSVALALGVFSGVGSAHAERTITLGVGTQCLEPVIRVKSAYEAKTGNKIKLTRDEGTNFDSVMLALDSGKAELGVIAWTWPEAFDVITKMNMSLKNLDKMKAHPMGKILTRFFTYAGGPVRLSAIDIKKILTGEADSWDDIGGEKIPLKMVFLTNSKGTQELFSRLFLGGEIVTKKNSKSFDTYPEIMDYMKKNKGTISFAPETLDMKGFNVPDQPEISRATTAITIGDPAPDVAILIDMASKVSLSPKK